MQDATHPIGIFDSGFGGLTVFRAIRDTMPMYDYLYMGDNARAPYGDRSSETIYEYTLQAVEWFFKQGCPLVILACNTASAEALRKIQQNDLKRLGAERRVLGVIRPTAEIIGTYTKTNVIGVLGTHGTIDSNIYAIEINEFYPGIKVHQYACPLWVPMIENNEHRTEEAKKFVQKDIKALMSQSPDIDTVLLGCTHYPLLMDLIEEQLPANVQVVTQAQIVASSLTGYLQRHPEIEKQVSRNGTMKFRTTDSPAYFDKHASDFFGESVQSEKIRL